MGCYACDREATQKCPRCGNAYCSDHGADLCAECLRPASAIPSTAVFRGSLLALLIGSVLALWLLIRPPGLPSESGILGTLPTEEPEPQETATPSATTTPQATPTLIPIPTPTPTPTPEPSSQTYAVQSGDTLSGIATQFGVTPEEIAAANGISVDDFLQVGQDLKIPPPSQ